MDKPFGSNAETDRPDHLGVFTKNRSALIRYASTITGDIGLAEDVVQDAWTRFIDAAEVQAIHEPDRFLFRIARNLALDARRRRAFEGRLFAQDATDAAQRIASDMPSAQASAEAADELAHIMDAVSRLPERTRQAFLLHRVEGLTLVEVGARLGLSKSLVHELVVSALEQCRKARRQGGPRR
ncbi:sigma-70 family RNA polymerase sigma factor [Novosphingobium sp. TCA1]|uniref:sigma-70 family RNA polymerase sigma factor n=1 Tax=Novosphingobium sp. TCA1 TaxID=2682474 RepID=UPI001308CE93|nr:sigma-70 family RNA polymerase sigma factor [Novosphingobium sp. TCA1]GFE72992.1 DNA-directed RNA polymerase sigma-70 factor [Novosphingobium sp. TCA1]